MPFDESQNHSPRPQLGRGEEGGALSRRLLHIALQQMVRHIHRGSGLAYGRISGLSEFEWRILARVCDAPGLSINDLGVVMGSGVGQVSRAVTRLVALGLLSRQRLGGGPGVAVNPTERGMQAYAPMVRLAEASERELVAGLTDEELRTLDRIIAVITENALVRLAREQQASRRADPEG